MTDLTQVVKDGLDAVSAKFDREILRLNDEITDLSQKSAGGGMFQPKKPATVADSFIKSDQLAAVLNGGLSTGRVEIKGATLQKASTTAASYDVPAQRDPGLYNNPQRVLSLIDALPSLKVNAGTFEYMRLNNYANAAAVQVNEGDAKAEGTVAAEVITANISQIAHYVRASLQILSDAPALAKQISNLLNYGVRAKLESELINGAGGTGKIHGLVPQATAFTPAAGTVHAADQVGEAITALESAGWNASLIVMHPTVWFSITSERADTGNGQYVMGSPRDPSGPSLWGVPVLTTPSIAANTMLVLDVDQVSLLDRESITVMASREDATNFTTNQVTLLGEGRFGLAVYSAGAVLKIVA